MKTYLKSPKAQKWGLFCLLAGALAFDLSFNPQTQHFTADFASSSIENGKFAELSIESGNEVYKAHVKSVDGKVTALMERESIQKKTEADNGTCAVLCGKTVMIDEVALNNQDDVKKIQSKLTDFVQKTQKEVKEHPELVVDKDKQDDSAKEDGESLADQLAATCEDKKDQLACHSKNLVELSKKLKNNKDQEDEVFGYYNEYVKPEVKSVLDKKLIHTEDGIPTADTDQYSAIDSSVKKLMAGLKSINGKSTREDLTKLISKSYFTQVKSAQAAIREGQAMNNNALVSAGKSALDPRALQDRLDDQIDSLSSGVDATGKDLIENNISDPVGRMIQQMSAAANSALSQPNPPFGKLANGSPSACWDAICQALLNFNANGVPSAYDPTGQGSVVGSNRSLGRGTSLSNAPWINALNQHAGNCPVGYYSNNVGNCVQQQQQMVPGGYQGQPVVQQQNCQVGFIFNGSTCVPQYQQQQMIPGGYQPQPMVQQPYQPQYQQPGMIPTQPGYNPGIRQAGTGRIQ